MNYLVIKLNETSYLGPRKGETVANIENARCYKNQTVAEKVASGHQNVPWFSNAKVVRRITVTGEFGGTWFKEETLS